MQRRQLAVAAAMTALAIAPTTFAQRGFGAIEIGKPFPKLVFRSMADGSPASIRDFRGKKVVLQIFASW